MAQNRKVKNPDPMSNTRTMGREGMKIIKDIAFSKFNIYNQGHIFRNIDFVKAVLAEVDKRLFEASIHAQAVQYAYGTNEDQRIKNIILRDSQAVEAYTIIRTTLCGIAQTGDTGLLLVLASKLPAYKYNI